MKTSSLTLLSKSMFTIDGGKTVVGYTDGNNWNGWATPRFELQAIEEWLTHTGNTWSYDPATDTITVTDLGVSEEEAAEYTNRYQGFDAKVDGHEVHLYAVGAWFWTWEDLFHNGTTTTCDICHQPIELRKDGWANDPVTAETCHLDCLSAQDRYQCPICHEFFMQGAHQCAQVDPPPSRGK